MRIGGFQKLTLLDYPGQVACIVFTAGCNFRCPFCHNGELVTGAEEIALVPEEEVFAYLEKRCGILDGLVLSGGEPLLQPDAEDFIRRVRTRGYLVKLDTNGSFPDRLERLLDEGLLDYVAVDIKAAPAQYGAAIGREAEEILPRIRRSVTLLRESGVPHEFRTTLVKGLHREEEIPEIVSWISGEESYYLQSYKESEGVLAPDGLGSFSPEELQRMLAAAQEICPGAQLRGV
ncbi:MAG: anaerobic ribonucleoside-triphosphate reductase activating protein [Lachnospiraceae bacterium]|nr:anaerobic ribonucleoside-triphosphate reductase activating protein [Lachnospiraceae bacterium]